MKRRYDRAAIVIGVAWTLYLLILVLERQGNFMAVIGDDDFLIAFIIGWAVLGIWPAIRWIRGGDRRSRLDG